MPAITVTVTLRIPPELLEVIDSCRGGVSRNEWMTTALQWAYANRGVVERALDGVEADTLRKAVAVETGRPPSPAPAEQPEPITVGEVGAELNALRAQRGEPPVRVWAESSSREFTPYPKGGKR